eukprot:GILJ01023858.1.p1 GENE.GILJ01023858.1~~GILJ01023858.1.p1  ORF type:complete len:172 (-),score=15.31 GILJ01023858.1:270-785(-)
MFPFLEPEGHTLKVFDQLEFDTDDNTATMIFSTQGETDGYLFRLDRDRSVSQITSVRGEQFCIHGQEMLIDRANKYEINGYHNFQGAFKVKMDVDPTQHIPHPHIAINQHFSAWPLDSSTLVVFSNGDHMGTATPTLRVEDCPPWTPFILTKDGSVIFSTITHELFIRYNI